MPQADIHEWKKAGLIEIPEGGNAMREIIKRVDKNLEQHLHDDGMRVSASRSHANPGTFHGAGTVDEFAVGKSNCNKIDCSVCLRSATYGTIRNTTALANEIKALEQLTGATEPIRRAKLMIDALERK